MSRGYGSTPKWPYLRTNPGGDRAWYGVASLAAAWAELRTETVSVDGTMAANRSAVVSLHRAVRRLGDEDLIECRYFLRPVTVQQTLVNYSGNTYTQEVAAHRRKLFVRLNLKNP
jgi:hypothetical protein